MSTDTTLAIAAVAFNADRFSPPSVAALLEVWEGNRNEPLAVRAFALLSLVRPDCSRDQLELISVGQRDRVLFRLREHLFGSQLTSTARCPACQETLELAFNVSDVLAPIMQRVPNAADLITLAAATRVGDAKRLLLERCLLSSPGKRSVPVWDDAFFKAVNEAMSQADPQAVVELNLQCPSCASTWPSFLDIASYLWRELEVWAKHTLREVHWLARAYGWSETQILTLSPNRRRLYLEMVNA
jgi:hypothetical protein